MSTPMKHTDIHWTEMGEITRHDPLSDDVCLVFLNCEVDPWLYEAMLITPAWAAVNLSELCVKDAVPTGTKGAEEFLMLDGRFGMLYALYESEELFQHTLVAGLTVAQCNQSYESLVTELKNCEHGRRYLAEKKALDSGEPIVLPIETPELEDLDMPF